MNKCMELDIQELLPDLLYRRLDAGAKARVEAHLASCGACREDLNVLRTVKAAAIFAPEIDVEGVVRQIPPYRAIVLATGSRARPRAVSWLVAASLIVVIAGGGSLLMIQQRNPVSRVAIIGHPDQAHRAGPGPVPSTRPAVRLAPRPVAPSEPPTHALAMATGVDGLSDNDLRQLMNDMNSFDALPATEPEPVISLGSGDNVDQGF